MNLYGIMPKQLAAAYNEFPFCSLDIHNNVWWYYFFYTSALYIFNTQVASDDVLPNTCIWNIYLFACLKLLIDGKLHTLLLITDYCEMWAQIRYIAEFVNPDVSKNSCIHISCVWIIRAVYPHPHHYLSLPNIRALMKIQYGKWHSAKREWKTAFTQQIDP